MYKKKKKDKTSCGEGSSDWSMVQSDNNIYMKVLVVSTRRNMYP